MDRDRRDTNYLELGKDDDIDRCTVTPQFVRDCALEGRITSGPGIEKRYMPTGAELDHMVESAKLAVTRGQMIDFGYWPNDMIREVGARAGVLYAQGALGHPFSTPYVIVHSWSDEKLPYGKILAAQFPDNLEARKSTCAYLVHAFPAATPGDLCVDFEVTLLEGIAINGVKMLGVGDRALLDGEQSKTGQRYCAHVIPFLWRFPDIAKEPSFAEFKWGSNRDGDDIAHSAVANAIDPVMVALLLLNTRGVRQETVAAPLKLNKARARRGKAPIPSYRKVDSSNYVTAIMQRVERVRLPATGTHASPVMHVRQGHWRHYQTGQRSFIRDTLVNASEEARAEFRAGRSHYRVAADLTVPEIKKEDEKK